MVGEGRLTLGPDPPCAAGVAAPVSSRGSSARTADLLLPKSWFWTPDGRFPPILSTGTLHGTPWDCMVSESEVVPFWSPPTSRESRLPLTPGLLLAGEPVSRPSPGRRATVPMRSGTSPGATVRPWTGLSSGEVEAGTG